ncbi:hypothetical protein CPB86DRAFT_816479 [Serendipita vermifera]|nr:hypothetical protein CPB86DRAFT_816479 [Serendipita vermifera]
MSLVAIRSSSTEKYLSLNATGMDHTLPEGGGSMTVSLQPHVGGWEMFKLIHLGGGTVAFESSTFSAVRMRHEVGADYR